MAIYENDLTSIYKVYCESTDRISGGLADKMTLDDIARKHSVSVKVAERELMKGITVEMEHTNSANVAKEISMDHLFEDIYYYRKLKKIESN